MVTTILQCNIQGLRCNWRDFDILVSEQQPDVVCLQETKREHSPPSSHYQCGNYDCHFKSLRRNPDQLSCGVSIYIKKELFHHHVQMDSHLRAVTVQVTMGHTPVTILSVYIPSSNHLTSRDLSYLTRIIPDQTLIQGDFNGHIFLWGSHDVDTRGEVIEIFTDKYNLCVLNDGTHNYLKPQVQHVNKPTSAIDLTISTPGLHTMLCKVRGRCCLIPMAVTTIPYQLLSYHQWQKYNQAVILHTGFSKANWEQFHDVCLERITEDILEEADLLHSFVEYITKAANDYILRATTIPKKSNPWFDVECREALKASRALDKIVRQSQELRRETISALRRSQAKVRRLFNQKKHQSWTEYVSKLPTDTPIKNVCSPKQNLNRTNGTAITNPKDVANEHAAAFTHNSSSFHYSAIFQALKEQEETAKINFTSDNTEV